MNHSSSDRPLVSVIVRTMGRPTLPRALHAVHTQTWRPIEVVIVGASGVEQAVVSDALASAPSDISTRFVDLGVPLPRARAANLGLEATRGEWLVFLDEDDEWQPEHLAGLMQAALNFEEPRVVYGNTVLMRGDEADWGVIGGPLDPLRMHGSSPFAIHAAVFPRTLLERGVRFDERLGHREDQDFWLQALQVMGFAYIEQTLATYHVGDGDSGSDAGMNGRREQISESERIIDEKWRAQRELLSQETLHGLRTAHEAIAARNLSAAEETLHALIGRFPKEVNTYSLLGMLHLETGRIDSAISLLRQATALAPGHFGFVLNLGLALERGGKTAEARECFVRALELNPDCAPAKLRLERV